MAALQTTNAQVILRQWRKFVIRNHLFLFASRELVRAPCRARANGTAEEDCQCLGGYNARPVAHAVYQICAICHIIAITALQKAASIAKNILTTEAIVADALEKASAGAGMPGGMGVQRHGRLLDRSCVT